MVDLPRGIPMYEQIDSAKGWLEVPLKTFTWFVSLGQTKIHRRGGEKQRRL